MKKALFTLAAFALAGSAFAQGKITLSNTELPNATGGGTYDAVITLAPALGGGFPGAGYTAGLFLEGTTTPLATTTFFNGTGAEAQFNYVFNTNPEVTVPGVQPGSTARFFVGAWRTDQGSFASASARGQSEVFTSRPLGGPNPTPGELPFTPPPTTFQGFQIVPEPSTLALGAIGLGALMLRRRK